MSYFLILLALVLAFGCQTEQAEFASSEDVFIESLADGSGSKVSEISLKPAGSKTVFAVARSSQGVIGEGKTYSWSADSNIVTVSPSDDTSSAVVTAVTIGTALVSVKADTSASQVKVIISNGPEISISTSTKTPNTPLIAISGICEKGRLITLAGEGNKESKKIKCETGTYFANVLLTDGDGEKEITASQTGLDGVVSTVTLTFTRSAFLPTIWNFLDSSKYTFDPQLISVSGNVASLQKSQQIQTSTQMDQYGTHWGTKVVSEQLTLDTTNSLENGLSSQWFGSLSSLIAYWSLDQVATDSSGNNNNVALSGNAAYSTESKIGTRSIELDGSGDYLEDSDAGTQIFNGKSEITLVAWVKSDVIGSDRGIFGSQTGDDFITLRYDAAGNLGGQTNVIKAALRVNGASKEIESAGNVHSLGWQHLALTWKSGENLKLYIDGKLNTLSHDGGTATGSLSDITWLRLGHHSTGEWDGLIDDVAVWTKALSALEIDTLFQVQKQKYSGIYTSQPIDLGTSGTWSKILATTELPFGKDIRHLGAELSGQYSSVYTTTAISSGLIGLWHFNETSVDSVVPVSADHQDLISNNHGNQTGGPQLNKASPLSSAIELDGNDDLITIIPSGGLAANYNDDFTIAGVIKTVTTQPDTGATSNTILYRPGPGGEFTQIVYENQTSGDAGKLSFARSDTTNNPKVTSNATLKQSQWHHFVATKSGTQLTLYIDGQSAGTVTDSSAAGVSLTSNMTLGTSPANDFFAGKLDDLAIWSRALNATEVLQIYRRSMNRVKYQFRTCDDSDCDTETWQGPGSGVFSLSELANPLATQPSFDLASLVAPNNRYFQYRIFLEAEDNAACSASACFPTLKQFEVTPSDRYYQGSPSIVNKVPAAFSKISEIQFSATCAAKYQISSDGVQFKYVSGGSWENASSSAESSTAADINSNIENFPSSGQLYFKAFLPSDGTEGCELKSVTASVKE